jgi:DNA repair protein RecO
VETDEAFSIQRLRYSETSLIITWLGRNHGIFRTLLRGGAKPGRSASTPPDMFQLRHVVFRPAKSHLHTLRSTELVDPFPALRASYPKTTCLAYFYELIAGLVEPDTPIPSLYDLFAKSAAYLVSKPPTPELVTRFEKRLALELGLGTPAHLHTVYRDHTRGRPPKSQALLETLWTPKKPEHEDSDS